MRPFKVLIILKKIINHSFFIGIILLPSAPFFSIIFFILASILSIIKGNLNFLKNKYNCAFFITGLIMFLAFLIQKKIPVIDGLSIDKNLSFYGLFNWIPFFILFWLFDYYLDSHKKRILAMKCFLLGTIPVLISGVGQYFFQWYGPIKFFNGLVIWYQRPLNESYLGITGLFNNSNYLGSWLSFITPFLFLFIFYSKKKTSKIFYFFFISLVLLLILLTYSRGSWVALIISIPLLFSTKILNWFYPLILVLYLPIFLATNQDIFLDIRLMFQKIFPYEVWNQFKDLSSFDIESSRITIWGNAISLIQQKPFFGWGGGSFPHLIKEKFGVWIGHPHNLFLELAVSYGIISAICTLTLIIILLLKRNLEELNINLINEYKDKSFLITNKTWRVSAICLFLTQMFDVQYFDIRISLSFWILITGLKCIINEYKIADHKKQF